MELINIQSVSQNPSNENDQLTSLRGETSTDKPFIQANTIESSLEEIREKHIIPVFIKDNEPVISHFDFINATMEVANEIFNGETILKPSIRLSHPVKGRIPEAKNKAAIDLLEHEKTLYFERMAFVIEIPTITDVVDGNTLSLTIGGVKALNLDNLYNKKGADEHFKVFIGFKNTVCTNLCVWTDGYLNDLKVKSLGQLSGAIKTLFQSYNANYHLFSMKHLSEFTLSEKQFATLIGRCRMYPFLPRHMQKDIQPLQLGDNQITTVVKDYFNDNSFCMDLYGNINLWRLYNLLTGACKSTYIDSFLDRSVNAFQFTDRLRLALKENIPNWFLS